MPMGIVSDEDFESELSNSSSDGGASLKKIPVPTGRGERNNGVPDSLRKIIGETAVTDGRQDALALADMFGLSPSSVSAYTNGATSTATMNKQPNLTHLNKARERVSARAMKKLRMALSHITEDKLAGTKAVELAQVAKSMSAIVKEMEPEKPKDDGEGKDKKSVTFVVFAPPVKTEADFEVTFAREG